MRRLKSDPVPTALLDQVLEAGTFAANGGNMQSWRFLVIRDPAIKAAAAVFYKKGVARGRGAALSLGRPGTGNHAGTVCPHARGGRASG